MKILNLNEWVNEGLWSKTLNRGRKGEERLENRIVLNIKDMKPIDLGEGVLIADIDLTINGEEKFDYYRLQEIKHHIAKTGWRVPKWTELKLTILKTRFLPPEMKDEMIVDTKSVNNGTMVYLKSKDTNETVEFYLDNPYGQIYWCDYDEADIDRGFDDEHHNARVMQVSDPKYSYNNSLFTFQNNSKDKESKVRLVKDR